MRSPRKGEPPRPILGIRFEKPATRKGPRTRREPDRLIVYLPDAEQESEGWLGDGFPILIPAKPAVH